MINTVIDKDESILLQIKPNKKAYCINELSYTGSFLLVWIPFVIGVAVLFRLAFRISFTAIIITSSIALIPLWCWFYEIFTVTRKWRNQEIYLTNKRIIVQSGRFDLSFDSIYYSEIHKIDMTIKYFDSLFNSGRILIYMNEVKPSTIPHMEALWGIENPEETYKKMQKIIFDIQADIEYPNELRPTYNPGYLHSQKEQPQAIQHQATIPNQRDPHLLPDEGILWKEKPDISPSLFRMSIYLFFVVIWTVISIPALIYYGDLIGPEMSIVIAATTFFLPLAWLGLFIFIKKQINSTTYYATNRRLLAVEKDNLLRDYVVTTSYPDVISVEMIDRDFWDKIFNVGTIYIKGKSSSIVFSIVKDPERCFNELQEIIRKKQSEISYPNISDDERKI